MAKGAAFTYRAKTDLGAIPQPIALQILRTLARFLTSEEGNVKRLQDIEPPLYRLRTQDPRMFRRGQGDHNDVTHIRNRREAYR